MKHILAIFALALGSLGSVSISPCSASDAAPVDAFHAPLDVGEGQPKIIIQGLDLTNPLNEAHVMETDLYRSQYYSHYHALFYGVNAPVLKQMPSAVDAEGKPLWFDGPRGDRDLMKLVSGLFERAQFDDLDRLYQDWNDAKELKADGRSKLTDFEGSMANMFSQISLWEPTEKLIRRWRDHSPRSAPAALTEAVYWTQYAWDARGTGYANTVTPEGWRLFSERLAKANSILSECKPYASGPVWTEIAIGIARDRGQSYSAISKNFKDQFERNKYYYPIYKSFVDAITPAWGGDWPIVDEFIKAAALQTRSIYGHSMYARLYLHVAASGQVRSNLFQETRADWPTLKLGFMDLMTRYPHSAWNLNKFAAYACVAGDRDTYRSTRTQLGNLVMPEAWPMNYSPDLCENKFPAEHL